jgi:peptidoglycan hydrolase-like protein with peptidoglycan-binding domain
MESKTKKYLLWGLGAVAVATGGFFLFKHLQERKEEKATEDLKDAISDPDSDLPESHGSASTVRQPSKPTIYNQFPLKYGSKGTLVRDIQTVLNKRYKAGIDVDGDWQGQTEAALKKFKLPTSFDSQAYAKLIAGSPKAEDKKSEKHKATVYVSPKSIAKKLHESIDKDNIFQALAALKQIKNKSNYNSVNEEFKKEKNWTFSDGYVSRTVVNAVLDQFGSSEYKKKINDQFYRIGLKFDGKKWSLSGLIAGTNQLITIQPAQVWDVKGNRMSVPRSTVLGTFIQAKNGITEFETLDGRILYANTIQLKYAA